MLVNVCKYICKKPYTPHQATKLYVARADSCHWQKRIGTFLQRQACNGNSALPPKAGGWCCRHSQQSGCPLGVWTKFLCRWHHGRCKGGWEFESWLLPWVGGGGPLYRVPSFSFQHKYLFSREMPCQFKTGTGKPAGGSRIWSNQTWVPNTRTPVTLWVILGKLLSLFFCSSVPQLSHLSNAQNTVFLRGLGQELKQASMQNP